MSILVAVGLGILQGLTEFLPVSSSAHLVLAKSFLSAVNESGVLFETILHLGTSLAVMFYFRKKLLKLDFRDLKLLIIASFPAAFVGLLFRHGLEALFESVKVVGFALIITGLVNYLTDRFKAKKANLSFLDSLVIGVAQAIAIVPGLSRSGATIFAGTARGVHRRKVAAFSFILSIPAVIGANALELVVHGVNGVGSVSVLFFGFIAAFITGFMGIKFVLKLLVNRHFTFFSIYCLVLGLLVVIFV